MFTNIIWGNSCIKYGKDSKGLKVAYEKIAPAEDAYTQVVEDFLGLNGRRWQSFLPVPRLWHRFYKRKHEFNDKYFVHVDFL